MMKIQISYIITYRNEDNSYTTLHNIEKFETEENISEYTGFQFLKPLAIEYLTNKYKHKTIIRIIFLDIDTIYWWEE